MNQTTRNKLKELFEWRKNYFASDEWEDVISSNVDSVKYDEDSQTMTVKFLNGSIYEYYDIPDFLYEEVINANSVGSHLHWNIKELGFEYKKIA